jgi:cyanophycin synthetase
MIELRYLATYVGPNPYGSDPVIVASLRVSAGFTAGASDKMTLVSRACATWFTPPATEGPVDEASVGRFIAHWALAALNEFGGGLTTALVIRTTDDVQVALGFYHPKLSFDALALAAKLLADIDRLPVTDFAEALERLWQACRTINPDYQAQFLIDYARKHDLPYRRHLPGTRLWQFGWGGRSEIFFESSPMEDSARGQSWARDKALSKQIFRALGVPTAPSVIVRSEAELEQAMRTVGFPCVTKPLDRGRSQGVTTDIRDHAHLIQGLREAAKLTTGSVMIERYVEGEVHRLIVVRGRLWKTIRRDRPHVVGDGRSTLLSLTEARNEPLRRQIRPGGFVGPVPLGDEFRSVLHRQGFGPEDVPAAGLRVRLLDIPLLSAGAAYCDVTGQVHPDVAVMAEALARAFGVASCGLDYIATDIGRSCFEQGAFIEINLTPGLRVPLMAGVPADEIARIILGDRPARLPYTLVMAPAADHEAIRARLPLAPSVGWACGGRTGLGSLTFPDVLPSIHQVMDRLVKHPGVASLILVADPTQLMSEGLPAGRTSRTIVLASARLDPKWREVAIRHTDQMIELPDHAALRW